MTPGQRRLSRRALLAGTGASAGALAAFEVVRLAGDDADQGPPSPGAPAETSQLEESGQTVDLTVRWRHLERRVQDDDLLAGWQFDEGSGYVFDDVSGRHHALHVTGRDWNTSESGLASAVHRKGLRGGSAYLTPTRWLAAVPTADLVPRSGLTLAGRFRVDSLPATSAVLMRCGAAYTLTLSSAGAVTLSVTDGSGHQRVVRTRAGAVSPGDWTHLTATAAPGGGILQLYVDGAPVSRADSQPFAMKPRIASLVVGGGLSGALDELAIYRVPLSAVQVRRLCVVGLPLVYTQTSESIDPARRVFTRFKGSDPVPHPGTASSVLSHRFDASTHTEQGRAPLATTADQTFVPGPFGGAWRATSDRLTYPSPLTGDSGSAEVWLRPFEDPVDPQRQRRKEILALTGSTASIVLSTESGRWQLGVRRSVGRTDLLTSPSHPFLAGNLEHVAVTWGAQAGGRHGVALYVNGAPAGFLVTAAGETSYEGTIGLGGTAGAPAYALFDDLRVSDVALPWGAVCPRGHASTAAAGLDLRDRFDRPPGAAPLLWRAGSTAGRWSHRRKTWERPAAVGADPESVRALFQGAPVGLHAAFHPDAYGHASSIEAGVAFPEVVDGWAGLFVQAASPGEGFSGLTFTVNPHRGQLRLARMQAGRLLAAKVLPHDFTLGAEATYELTLTNAGDGVVRGFVDGSNVISTGVGAGWPGRGYAGMLTEDARAFFSDLHFCALTPATPASRVIRTEVQRYGDGAAVGALGLVPFRWQKRRGLLPWQYTYKDPEPAGNIAGADTPSPLRPIGPAGWRSEDSANSDLITLGDRVFYVLRGNPRIANRASVARVGVLSTDVPSFDGIHFTDPNASSGLVRGGTVLASGSTSSVEQPVEPGSLQLNEPSTAYVGGGRFLFLGRESTVPQPDGDRFGRLAFSRFDVGTATWEHAEPQHLPWSVPGPLTETASPPAPRLLRGTPEVVSLRRADDDSYQAVVFQQTGAPGRSVMATAMLDQVDSGVPRLAPGYPVRTSLSRSAGGAIYGFRVMFDNGIYYLHYNDGPQVPDWPDRFVLAASLDPYAGPWVENAESTDPDSTYFVRGEPFQPDNGAIWQGTMFKHRGRYYLYYENFHAVDNVDQPYEDYANPQVGSRVGFATA